MKFLKRSGNADTEKVMRMAKAHSLEPAFAALLVSRGVSDADVFLHPGEEQLNDPFLFKNMAAVCERIKTAVENKEKIAVYADYDADGICSAAIMVSALRSHGAAVSPYIPDRKTEGYGTNPEAIRMICEKGFSLIISVDCGIRSVSDVALAKSLGTDFIILDHHELGELPDTPYIVDPKAEDEGYPFRELCGAGVAFKTVWALYGRDAMKYIDLAGVATIGDIVSLTGENRAITQLGIEKLNRDPNPGLYELCCAAGIDTVKSRQVSFGIVPRLNAAGRMSHAKFALEMLLTNDAEKRRKLALWLNNINSKRQSMQAEIFAEAAEQIRKSERLCVPSVLTAVKSGWEHGLVGLAAAKVAEQFGRPAIVFTENDGMLTGSARSAFGVNIYEVLNAANELYTKFGGHSQAAGLSLPAENLPVAKEIWNRKMLELYTDADFEKQTVYDEEVTAKDLSFKLARQIELLEPMGQDNPEPVFLLKGAKLGASVALGGGKHYKAPVLGEDRLEVIRFGVPEPLPENTEAGIAGTFSINSFRNSETRQLSVLAMDLAYKETPEKDRFLGAAVAEISAFSGMRDSENVFTEKEEFFCELNECLDESPLGTLVIIASEEGEKAYRENLKTVKYPPEAYSADSADNAVLYGVGKDVNVANYRDIFLCGCCAAKLTGTAVIRRLKVDYTSLAKELYLSKEEIIKLSMPLKRAAGYEYAALGEYAVQVMKFAPEFTLPQIWFGINVFYNLGMLKLIKKEKIFVEYKGNSIDNVELIANKDVLAGSSVYTTVEKVARGQSERILF